MKVLLLGDMHFGIKNDDPYMEAAQERVITKVCNYVKENDVKVIIQTGDWFDVRRGVTHRTMEFLRTRIMPQLAETNTWINIIVGNHDCQHKNTLTPNAVREHLSDYEVTIHDRPNTITLTDGTKMDMIPWYCSDNAAEINSHIKSSTSPYCVAHWELSGHYLYTGLKAQSGLDPDFLNKYDRVFSGHYHVKSEAANVYYVGTPYTMTANDENDVKGFVVLETETGVATFVSTEETNHIRLVYPGDIDYEACKDKNVRLIINEVDKDLPKVETLLESICNEFRTVNNVTLEIEDGEINPQQGLQHIINEYIKASTLEENEKESVTPLMQALFTEASCK